MIPSYINLLFHQLQARGCQLSLWVLSTEAPGRVTLPDSVHRVHFSLLILCRLTQELLNEVSPVWSAQKLVTARGEKFFFQVAWQRWLTLGLSWNNLSQQLNTTAALSVCPGWLCDAQLPTEVSPQEWLLSVIFTMPYSENSPVNFTKAAEGAGQYSV